MGQPYPEGQRPPLPRVEKSTRTEGKGTVGLQVPCLSTGNPMLREALLGGNGTAPGKFPSLCLTLCHLPCGEATPVCFGSRGRRNRFPPDRDINAGVG